MIDTREAHRLFEAILSEAALGAQVVDPKAASMGPLQEATNLENLDVETPKQHRNMKLDLTTELTSKIIQIADLCDDCPPSPIISHVSIFFDLFPSCFVHVAAPRARLLLRIPEASTRASARETHSNDLRSHLGTEKNRLNSFHHVPPMSQSEHLQVQVA